jgi:hypothetical protein
MAKQLNEVGRADVKSIRGRARFLQRTRPSYNAEAAADAWTLTLTFSLG